LLSERMSGASGASAGSGAIGATALIVPSLP
jgi:hypothetical protein